MAVHAYQVGGGGRLRGEERERQEYRGGDAPRARWISAQREQGRERVHENLAAPGLPPKPRPSTGITASRVQTRVVSLKGGIRVGFDSPGGPSSRRRSTIAGWDNVVTPEHNRRGTIADYLGQHRDAGAESRANDQIDPYLEQ
jgi:hypothetical protein